MAQFECSVCASQGARSYQEDTALVRGQTATGEAQLIGSKNVGLDEASIAAGAQHLVFGSALAVLADGMGGHAGGSVASRIVCDAFVDAFSSDKSLSDGLLEDTAPDRLTAALDRANSEVADRVGQEPALAGMGSTAIAVWLTGQHLHWVSVGDSSLYLYRQGDIAVLNQDHSLAPELDKMAAAGIITLEQAQSDPRRHMLRSAVTGDDIELIDTSKAALTLEPGDFALIASDGLHTLDKATITSLIEQQGQTGGARGVAQALIEAVDGAGATHQDNTTVVVLRVLGDV
ncbi:MAG: protein phosphatase 2C domain-containing protein [Pseudomonadota bacterium]